MIRQGEIAYPVTSASTLVRGTPRAVSSLHDPIYDAFVSQANALFLMVKKEDQERKLYPLVERAFQDAGKNLQFEPMYSLLNTASQMVEERGFDREKYERLFVNIQRYAGSVFQEAMRDISFEVIPDEELGDVLLMAGTLLRQEEGKVRLAHYRASPEKERYAMTFEDIGTVATMDEAVSDRREGRLIESLIRVEAPPKWSLEKMVFPLFYHTFPRLPGLTSSRRSA